MKTETASSGMIATGGGMALTFQGYIQIVGMVIGLAGVIIGYLNWKENKRRNDLLEAQQNAESKNSTKG